MTCLDSDSVKGRHGTQSLRIWPVLSERRSLVDSPVQSNNPEFRARSKGRVESVG
jgi:hypothetical protein